MKEIPTKKLKGLCVAYRCTNKHKPKDKYCAKHRKRKEKETNLVGVTFWNLKSNAKRRNKDFNLTLDEFKIFCERTNYLKLKGRVKNKASIDRIDPNKGYSLDNINILTVSENSKKRYTDEQGEKAPF